MALIDDVVDRATSRYLAVFRAHMARASGMPFHAADLVMFGLINRQLGLLRAMPALFNERNIHALAPLVRVQLDGLLRLTGFRFVESMDDLARYMIGGRKFSKYKDRDGNQMRDAHLVSLLKVESPDVEHMYETLSGWTHLSECHVFSAVLPDANDDEIIVGVGDLEPNLDDSHYGEAINALDAIHARTADLIEAYFTRGAAA